MLVNEAPEAVKAKPTEDIVNFIDFAEAPTVHCAVAGTRLPVDRVTLPAKVIGVAIWLALITEVVVFSTAFPSCKQIQ